MTMLKTFLGYPEPDGGVPFALWFPLEDRAILIAGIINRGANGVQDLESEQIPPSTEDELLARQPLDVRAAPTAGRIDPLGPKVVQALRVPVHVRGLPAEL